MSVHKEQARDRFPAKGPAPPGATGKGPAPPGAMPPGLGARIAATTLLGAIFSARLTLEDLLNAREAMPGQTGTAPANARACLDTLKGIDRAHARALAGAALRHRGQTDRILNQLIAHLPKGRSARHIRDILRIGATEILFMNTPPHAACHAAVAQTRTRAASRHYAGFVNGVLRTLSARAGEFADMAGTPLAALPGEFAALIERENGPVRARDIATMLRAPPPLDLTFKTARLRDASPLEGLRIGPDMLRIFRPRGRIEKLSGFERGEWWAQNIAASLAVRLFGDVREQRILDMCAAPGGKTLQLCAAGARVTALDRSPTRLARLQENLQRTGFEAYVIKANAAEWTHGRGFDGILLDAPCSATGIVRRHPEIAWLRAGQDIAPLLETQDRLLQQAVRLLAPGGTLIYAVCSLMHDEGAARIDRLLDRDKTIRRCPVAQREVSQLCNSGVSGRQAGAQENQGTDTGNGPAGPDPFAGTVSAQGDIRTLPCHFARAVPQEGGLDGFFIARLKKRPG